MPFLTMTNNDWESANCVLYKSGYLTQYYH
jgi:hypothetical protein